MAEARVPGGTRLRNSQDCPVTSHLQPKPQWLDRPLAQWLMVFGPKNADANMIRTAKEISAGQWRLACQQAASKWLSPWQSTWKIS